MKTKELRDLSVDELNQKEKLFKKDLFDLNYKRKLSQVEKPSNFKKLRCDIARIQTVLNERDTKHGTTKTTK